ncbi:MAG TPA: hypothetical protein VJ692_07365 [Nitrospiraceae bacterium]|nr:hypothetical protein [Nitrospiraceae bacterium]
MTLSAEVIARELAISYERDPDELTSWLEMCDANNQPVPTWRVYEEQAEHLLKTVLASPAHDHDLPGHGETVANLSALSIR